MGSREEEGYFSISHYRINGATFETVFTVINRSILAKRTNYSPPLFENGFITPFLLYFLLVPHL